MEFIDYYHLLGIDKSASQATIKKAYRKLARKHHPDLNPNDKAAHQKFQQINEAHNVLSDPEKRKKYDRYGKDWEHAEAYEKAKQQQPAGGFAQKRGSTSRGGFSEGEFSDFFESMFGSAGQGKTGRRSGYQFKGQDFNASLGLNLTDILKTQKQTIDLGGKKIRITIPAGVENGQTIKIKGYGAEGMHGGPKGDLFITFDIKNNTEFKRVGNNLYKTEEIDLYKALLGGEIKTKTLDGQVKLNVKPETQNGTRIKLKGKGMPKYKAENEYGDLYIAYSIVLPKKLTEKEKELFNQLSKLR